jgi:hypothetical protein
MAALASDASAASPKEDFGQYLVDHQDDLAPFFSDNAGELFRQAVPLLMGMLGWITLLTMLIGWALDILLSRGYAYFFAPAFPEIKRSIIYATGRLVLSAVYTMLMGLAVVLTQRLTDFPLIIAIAFSFLILVALAAQIVWVLYLFRTDVPISAAFYIVVLIVHAVVGTLVALPMLGAHAPVVATGFVDGVLVPRMRAEIDARKHDLAASESARKASQAKTDELQGQLTDALTAQSQLHDEIEARKKSDFFVFSQIGKVRAGGDLNTARSELNDFLSSFPTSSLAPVARAQLTEVTNELAQQDAQKKQQAADAIRTTAQARTDLLARAAKGEVSLSEMRRVLIGKTRDEVNGLLGPPTDTASDTWAYRQQMVFNPLTNEKFGLTVNFLEGVVQGVDYNTTGYAR